MGAIPIFGTDGAQRRASGTWGTRGVRIPPRFEQHCKKQNLPFKRLSIMQGCSNVLKNCGDPPKWCPVMCFVPHHI